MERSSILMSSALGLYAMTMVEVPASFMAPGASVGGLRGASVGTGSSSQPVGSQPLAGSAAGGLRCVAAGLAVSAACLSVQAGKSRANRSRAQRKATPAPYYASALLTAANEGGESLDVAKEMFALKEKLDSDESGEFMAQIFGVPKPMTKEQITKSRIAASDLASLSAFGGESFENAIDKIYKPSTGPAKPQVVDKVKNLTKAVPELESKTITKFLSLLDKKQEFEQLPAVCTAYTTMLYKSQKVAPVLVRSAQPLSEKQTEAIANKMKARIGCEEVKITQRVDSTLIAGFRIEWNFLDPVNFTSPADKEDITFRRAIERAVMSKAGQETLD